MILIENKVISDEVVTKHFTCNLDACKGACCVEGENGAPLEKGELDILEKIYPKVKPFLTPEGIEAIEKQGLFVRNKKGDEKTPLVEGGACAYAVFENGLAKCGIEKAYEADEINFRKPISCHLYPVRVTKTDDMEFLNYEEWDICNPACTLGKSLQKPLYRFVKEALIRKYGEDFFEVLEASAKHASKESG